MIAKVKKSKKHGRVFEGVLDVCCHRVTFYFDIPGIPHVEDFAERMEEEAEERAQFCISEGCYSGDLCTVLVRGQKEYEIFGWWSIEG
jgi:hypothetical protein